MPVFIDDPQDARIADYRDIRERDLVGRRGHFIAEGEVVLKLLLTKSRHRARSLLIADKRIAGLEPLLRHVPEDVPVYAAAQHVLDTIAGFPLHRGILALGETMPPPSPEALLASLPAKAVILVLIGIANHDNVGGIFRAAAAFGVDAVLLDEQSCDPLYRKAIRVSVGAALTVPFCRVPDAALLPLLSEYGFEPIALSPAGATTLSQLRRPDRAAVILGAEGPGLPDAFLSRARTVSIPMANGFNSLNVAMTCGIVLHHLVFAASDQRTE